jgi:Subtilase family
MMKSGTTRPIGLAVALGLAVLSSALAQSPATQPGKPDGAAFPDQLRPRDAAEGKISSMLLPATRPPVAAQAVFSHLRFSPQKDADGRVELDVTAIISPALLEAIKELGGVVEFAPKDPASHSLRILAPLASIAKLAARSDVLVIRKAMPVLLNAADQHGFTAHNAAIAQTTLGARGAGVKVGVMSDSADDSTGALKRAFASGDIPTSLKILDFQAGGGIGEGLAIMEIVHRIAPDASLVFATGNGNSAATAENIRALAAAGCKIIIDDVTHFDESPFQDSEISRAVKDLSSTGVMFFSAAGNNGNKRSGTSSTFEGDFVPSGQFLSGSNAPHEGAVAGFTSRANGAVSDRVVLSPRDAGNAVVVLYWSDPLADIAKGTYPANQYDLLLFDAQDNLVGYSVDTMANGKDPMQMIDLSENPAHPAIVTGDYVKVVKATQSASRFLHLEVPRVPFANQSIATDGAVRGHNTSEAANAFSVAAVQAPINIGTFADGTVRQIEARSSDGPRRMFYAPDGSELVTGSGPLSSGGVVLRKPDMAAADGVVTTLPPGSLNPYFGTSAAAPHAGAIAALILSARPGISPTQVRFAMNATSINAGDIGSGAFNTLIRGSGYALETTFVGPGIVMADAAVAFAKSISRPLAEITAPKSWQRDGLKEGLRDIVSNPNTKTYAVDERHALYFSDPRNVKSLFTDEFDPHDPMSGYAPAINVPAVAVGAYKGNSYILQLDGKIVFWGSLDDRKIAYQQYNARCHPDC